MNFISNIGASIGAMMGLMSAARTNAATTAMRNRYYNKTKDDYSQVELTPVEINTEKEFQAASEEYQRTEKQFIQLILDRQKKFEGYSFLPYQTAQQLTNKTTLFIANIKMYEGSITEPMKNAMIKFRSSLRDEYLMIEEFNPYNRVTTVLNSETYALKKAELDSLYPIKDEQYKTEKSYIKLIYNSIEDQMHDFSLCAPINEFGMKKNLDYRKAIVKNDPVILFPVEDGYIVIN